MVDIPLGHVQIGLCDRPTGVVYEAPARRLAPLRYPASLSTINKGVNNGVDAARCLSDQYGNPYEGASVEFFAEVLEGAGLSFLSPPASRVLTDALGQATISWSQEKGDWACSASPRPLTE
jgi:hypothetical protein